MKNFISIDIGVLHMGIICALVNDDFTLNKIVYCSLDNITEPCTNVGCNLTHENNFTDYMLHYFDKYEKYFEEAETILVEQQPPMGLQVIQELIRFKYRNKTITVSPKSMHCYFSIQNLDYEQRKKATISLSTPWLSENKNFVFQTRKADIADALCILIYFISVRNKEYLKQNQIIKWRSDNSTLITNLNEFRYTSDVESITEIFKEMDI